MSVIDAIANGDITIIDAIAEDIRLSPAALRESIIDAMTQHKIYFIGKRNGGNKRKIVVPPRIFKLVQYWTISHVLRYIPIHESATAFTPGSSILKNAKKHLNGSYFVKVDIHNFFPSISSNDFFSAIKEYDETKESRALLLSENDHIFLNCLFYKYQCGIGFPVSPYIANIVMRCIDSRIVAKLADRQDDFGKFSYTRYADDMTVSIEQKGFKYEVIDIICSVLKDSKFPRLKLNEQKTKFGSKNGGSAFITGLRICKDGRVTLHRKYKDHVRLLLSLGGKGVLNPEEKSSLVGHLNYCAHVDPGFYTRLVMKHLDTIRALNAAG